MTDTERQLTAARVVRELKQCGVTHVVWLPDGEVAFLYPALAADPDFTLVQVCREGEAIGIAAGLLMGGKKPVILIQNSGFHESGDSVRGMGLDFHLPLVMLIGLRHWHHDKPVTDTATLYTRPVLDAFGIKYHIVETDDDVASISLADREATETGKPVAILIGGEYSHCRVES